MSEQKLDVSAVRRSFFNTSIADVYRAIDGRSLVGAYTLLLCSIDSLANLAAADNEVEDERCSKCGQCLNVTPQECVECHKLSPSSDAGKIFRKWCDRWLKKELKLKKCNPQFLYELRCGLVHAHGVGKNMKRSYGFNLQHDLPTNHWKEMHVLGRSVSVDLKPGYILNLESLLAEYVLGAWKFFSDWEVQFDGDEQALSKRLLRLIGMFGLDEKNRVRSIGLPPNTFSEMHPSLRVFDQAEIPTLDEIRFHIHEIYEARQGMCKCNSVHKYMLEEQNRIDIMKSFNFEKLSEFGKKLFDLVDQYDEQKLDETEFRAVLKKIASPADQILLNFPNTEYPLLKIKKDFRQSIKEVGFESKSEDIQVLVQQVDDYRCDFASALSEMLFEAETLDLIPDWQRREWLREMGMIISGGLL